MPVIKATGRELVERWILQNLTIGKTNEELLNTTFVYGDEILTLAANEQGNVEIETRHGKVVVFRQIDELDMTHTCRACGTEHQSHKEAIECCMEHE